MDFFEFKNYKTLILKRIKQMPKQGHGQFNRLAHHLGIHSTMVSHVFNGDKNLTTDQAYGVCDYFGFNELQTDYFLILVEQDRAANHKLKSHYEKKLNEIRKKASEVAERLPQDHKFSEAERGTFYSQWYYSGIRLLTALSDFQDLDSIANHFGLPKKKVADVLEFLLKTRLCVMKDGKYNVGPMRTHVEADSPLASRHHGNWRLKAIESFDKLKSDEIVFTSPVILETKDALKIRNLILDFVESTDKVFDKSGNEELFCLNVDWVRVR